MTHSSQRRGLSDQCPGEEMITDLMVSPRCSHIEGIQDAVREYFSIREKHGINKNSDHKKIAAMYKELMGNWLTRNRKKGIPVSLRMSGLFSDIRKICRAAGMTEHTYLHSLGFFGKGIGDMPSEKVLSLITQCGHGYISRNRVALMVDKVKRGILTPEEAAAQVTTGCRCGVANKVRAEDILRSLARDR